MYPGFGAGIAGQHINFAQWRQGPGGVRRTLLALVLLTAMIGGAGALVYHTGGTTYTWPYLMILPILLAAALFQLPGGLLAAFAGGLVLGPFMPLEVSQGLEQTTANWLLRLAVLCGIGLFAGLLFQVVAEQMRQLQAYARVNADTGLPNQQALEQELSAIMQDDSGEVENGVRCYLLAIHINNYGSISSMLGPKGTTELVHTLASKLDTLAGKRGKTFQTATDQLILMLRSSRRNVLQTARDVISTAQGPHELGEQLVYVDSYLGAAAYPFHETDDPVVLIRKVMSAMFMAREQDRPYATYDSRLDDAGRRQSRLLGKLRPAIADDELILHYQPKIDLHSGRVSGVEALVRWPQADGSLAPPGDFIPIAEQSGLIHPLTHWVLETALEQQISWRQRGIELSVAVNISPRNFSDEAFPSFVRDLLQHYALAPGSLEMEITEGALMRNPGQVAHTVNELAKLGVIFSIDDFGTGYSSLAYLEQLAVSVLKIDQTFVRQMNGASNAPIVRGSILLAHSLDLGVVAEGIENQETADALAELGCNTGQGYYYCRPQPARELGQWLARRGHAG